MESYVSAGENRILHRYLVSIAIGQLNQIKYQEKCK